MNLRRSLAMIGVAIVGVVSLSGCMRMDTDLYVNSDAQIDKVSLTLAMNKEQMKQLGSMGGSGQSVPMDLDSFKQSILEQNGTTSDKMEKICQFSETDKEWIATCGGTVSELEAIGGETSSTSGLAEGVGLTKDGNTIKMSLDMSALSGSGADMSQLKMLGATGIQYNMRVHFPGEVKSVSGGGASIDSNDPNVVVVDLLSSDGSTVTAEASAGGPAIPVGGILIGVVLIGALVAVAVFIAKRGSGSGGSASAPASAPMPSTTPEPGTTFLDGEVPPAPPTQFPPTPPTPPAPPAAPPQ